MQVVVDNLLTNYDKKGKSAKTILLIHGWGDNRSTFDLLVSEMSTDYQSITLDLPGFGQTQSPNEVWNLDNYVEFVRNFLEKIGADHLTAIVAHSNGAAVAIRGLSQGKLKADKLVLLGAAGIRNRQKAKRLALKLVAKTGKVATFWLPKSTKKKLQKTLYGAAGSDMLVAPHLQETFKVTVRQDVQADAKSLNLPTLIIYGQDDRATPPLYGQIFHQLIQNSKLQIIENAGHFVHQDQTTEVANLIKEFLV